MAGQERAPLRPNERLVDRLRATESGQRLTDGLTVEQPVLLDPLIGGAAAIASNRMRRSSSIAPATAGHAGASAALDEWTARQTGPVAPKVAPAQPTVQRSAAELEAAAAEDERDAGKSAEQILAEIEAEEEPWTVDDDGEWSL